MLAAKGDYMLKPCKRIEIVIERSQQRGVASALDAIPVSGYTILFNAGGTGDRGPRRADDVTDTDENCVFIIATEDDAVVDAIVQKLQPVLKRYGGICLVSDAQWL
jgi:nitrogen regulatory protein PII